MGFALALNQNWWCSVILGEVYTQELLAEYTEFMWSEWYLSHYLLPKAFRWLQTWLCLCDCVCVVVGWSTLYFSRGAVLPQSWGVALPSVDHSWLSVSLAVVGRTYVGASWKCPDVNQPGVQDRKADSLEIALETKTDCQSLEMVGNGLFV